MPKVEVFDPPMCCATGVCGPVVDATLPRFAGDLDWLARHGVPVTRFNLAQQPGAFAGNAVVVQTLREAGSEALPILLIDGQVVSHGRYPSREELARWAGLEVGPGDLAAALTLPALDGGPRGPGCCG